MDEFNDAPSGLPKCFLISPIGQKGSEVRVEADKVLNHLVRKAVGDRFEVLRGDEDTNPGSITDRLVTSILDADLVIADLSGHNANVFYEVAIAHGYRRPIVHIEREGERPPFDLQDMRLVRYDTSDLDSIEEAKIQLAKYAEAAVSDPGSAKTPLSHSQQFREYSRSKDPVVSSMADLMNEVGKLRTEVRRFGLRASEGGDQDADRQQFARIISRLVKKGAIDVGDLRSAITFETTPRFDDWVRRVAARVAGTQDEDKFNHIIYKHDELIPPRSTPEEDFGG